MQNGPKKKYDAIIIGSGFGGTMIATKLVNHGMKVLMVERGGWVERGPQNWGMNSSIDLTPHYDKTQAYQVVKGGNKKQMGVYSCVGGPSVFYGGVSFRFREEDFTPPPEITADSKAKWPINYFDLQPYYAAAESLLQISGVAGIDPTEPPRMLDFPQAPGKFSEISEKIKMAAESLGLHPYHLPLAINYHSKDRTACAYCTTCDTFACAIQAKNDLATCVIPGLIQRGMELKPNTMVTNISSNTDHISKIEYVDLQSQERGELTSDLVILSAGALSSPHLALSSRLGDKNPSGDIIGRYLMRHVNAILFGIFPSTADKEKRFHKQLAILDYYFGENGNTKFNKVGSLQQVPTPPEGLVQNEVPGALGKFLSKGVRLLTGLLAIAEDQPQYQNQIKVDLNKKGGLGLAEAFVSHEYSKRDKEAIKFLTKRAKKIMRKSGAWFFYEHHIRTFSHAVGTMRMGEDPTSSVLDRNCQFRGIENLYVVDGSFMPTSAALNPSLTISANALRVGDFIIGRNA